MGRGSAIRRRLEALESHAPLASPENFSDWPLEDQMQQVLDCLQAHRWGGTTQLATDRQIHLMGLLCALEQLPGGVGKHHFPSGVVVSWRDNGDGTCSACSSGYVRVEDLPEGVREHFERMDPAEQPERERWLYEDRHRAKERSRSNRIPYEEATRPYREESARRDRELLERNRALVEKANSHTTGGRG